MRSMNTPGYQQADKRLSHTLRVWAQHGAQSVQMPHTYAAAMAATSVGDALKDSRLPWPAFEVQVPPGLITTPYGDVVSAFLVDQSLGWTKPIWTGENAGRNLVAIYVAGVAIHFVNDTTLSGLLDADDQSAFDQYDMPEDDVGAGWLAKQKRIWTVVKQLLAGVVLSIEQARNESPSAYGPRPLRAKHNALRANTFVLGKPLKLDCRADVAAYLAGTRHAVPRVCTIVRGHWCRQPHGPERSLRKVIWRKPHPRGHGPMIVRPIVIGNGAQP